MPVDIFIHINKVMNISYNQTYLQTCISQNQYKLTMPEYRNSSTNIKFEHQKCIRISEKAHLRSDFRKKIISLSGARTHESTILSGQK